MTKNGNRACLAVDRAVLQAIVADPADHWANIHSLDYPQGAIRGQLSLVAKMGPASELISPLEPVADRAERR